MFEKIKLIYGCKKVYGPYLGDDGRQRCVLYFEDQSTSSRSYAKLLVEADLGRRLSADEEADHIDDNCSNDNRNNLQNITREQNVQKQREYIFENLDYRYFDCAQCGAPGVHKPHIYIYIIN